MDNISFNAVHFRLANTTKSSIVCIEITQVINGLIQPKKHWLVKPNTELFDPFNEAQREYLTFDDVKDCKTFKEIWPEIEHYFNNQVVIAQNTAHVITMLRAVLDEYEIDYPEVTFYDSKDLSKKQWGNMVYYDLMLFVDKLGIDYSYGFGNMANGISQLILKLLSANNIKSLEKLEDSFNCIPGRFSNNKYHAYHSNAERWLKTHGIEGSRKGVDWDSIVPEITDFDTNHIFYDKAISFTGKLSSLTREQAVQNVINCGSEYHKTPKKDTNYLVIGEFDPRTFASGASKTKKLKKAEDLISKGSEIEVLSEGEFIELISSVN